MTCTTEFYRDLSEPSVCQALQHRLDDKVTMILRANRPANESLLDVH